MPFQIIKNSRGSAVVETLMAFPLLVIMGLSFIELGTWMLLRVQLWKAGQVLVRVIGGVDRIPDREAALEAKLRLWNIPAKAHLQCWRLKEDPERHRLRKNYPVYIVQLKLSRSLNAQFPPLRQIFRHQKINLEVTAYEAFM